MHRILHLFLLIMIVSCADLSEKKPPLYSKKESKKILSAEKKAVTLQKDTLTFVDYNDNGDYMLLNAEKDHSHFSFINDKNDDRTLLKGDLIEITWKKDTIYISGDGQTPELAEWLVSFRKLKEGNVSLFRKNYKKQIKYNWTKEGNYSKEYLDQLYLIIEHYIANSKNELVKHAVSKKEQIEYSIEEQTRDGKQYIVIGIATVFEHRVNTMQWLYLEQDLSKTYEYDLPNDQLVKFD